MHLPIKVGTDTGKDIETKALLNSGMGGVFVSHEFTEKSGLRTSPLKRSISVRNVDGTPNKRGTISHYARGKLKINEREFETSFLIAGLGDELVILGLPWLQRINPIIDWEKGTFKFQENPQMKQIQRIMAKTREKWGILGETRSPQPTVKEIPNEELAPETQENTEPIGPQDKPTDRGKLSSQQTEPDTLPALSPNEEEYDPPDEDKFNSLLIAYLRGKSTLEIFNEELEPGDRIIAYVQGEPIIGIFDPLSAPNPPPFQEPKYSYGQKPTTISRIIKSWHPAQYSYGQNLWIRAKTSVSQHLAHSQESNEPKKTLNELLPPEYLQYCRVFKKEASKRFPEPRPWDHAIDLKPDFIP